MNLHADAAEYAWLALRFTYRLSRHEPLMLTDLSGERPFTVTDAIGWGERLAERVLS